MSPGSERILTKLWGKKRKLASRYPIRIIGLIGSHANNYATHKTDKIRRWFERHPRFQVYFTPTGASWINLVERFFAKITTEAIRRVSFKSTAQLRKAMDQDIEAHNNDPNPFNWTATADSIF